MTKSSNNIPTSTKILGGILGAFTFPAIKFASCFTAGTDHIRTGNGKAAAGEFAKGAALFISSPIAFPIAVVYGANNGYKQAEKNNPSAFTKQVARNSFGVKSKEVDKRASTAYNPYDLGFGSRASTSPKVEQRIPHQTNAANNDRATYAPTPKIAEEPAKKTVHQQPAATTKGFAGLSLISKFIRFSKLFRHKTPEATKAEVKATPSTPRYVQPN